MICDVAASLLLKHIRIRNCVHGQISCLVWAFLNVPGILGCFNCRWIIILFSHSVDVLIIIVTVRLCSHFVPCDLFTKQCLYLVCQALFVLGVSFGIHSISCLNSRCTLLSPSTDMLRFILVLCVYDWIFRWNYDAIATVSYNKRLSKLSSFIVDPENFHQSNIYYILRALPISGG